MHLVEEIIQNVTEKTDETLFMAIEGKQVPEGTVKISGAKNAATRIMAASLIAEGRCTLLNFPTNLLDVRNKGRFLKQLGASVLYNDEEETLEIESSGLSYDLMENYKLNVRTTYLLVPGLLKKCGIAKIPYPGGCKIGDRRYDLHVMVWEKMGCNVTETENYIEVKGILKAAEIDFPISTIGGTESALICAALVQDTTIIRNAYVSPEVQSLIEFLKSIGVEVVQSGNSYIEVRGPKFFRPTTYRIIPDRIEALTWIIFGAISGGRILLKDVPFDIMQVPLIHLRDAGIDFYRNSSNAFIEENGISSNKIQPFEIACGTHPGVISDMQPFYSLLAMFANGTSRIYDYRYPNRTSYIDELQKFYKNKIEYQPGAITIKGGAKLTAADVNSTDLRGSMAVMLAGFLADGTSIIRNINMAMRGYNNLDKKLKNLGLHYNILSE
jgi:UDP-N-acetylglucosamine 1-carboxyvinyltransferase